MAATGLHGWGERSFRTRAWDVLLEELQDFAVIPPHGGWSLLLDVSPLGLDGATAPTRLLELGKIAATAMINGGSANSTKIWSCLPSG